MSSRAPKHQWTVILAPGFKRYLPALLDGLFPGVALSVGNLQLGNPCNSSFVAFIIMEAGLSNVGKPACTFGEIVWLVEAYLFLIEEWMELGVRGQDWNTLNRAIDKLIGVWAGLLCEAPGVVESHHFLLEGNKRKIILYLRKSLSRLLRLLNHWLLLISNPNIALTISAFSCSPRPLSAWALCSPLPL